MYFKCQERGLFRVIKLLQIGGEGKIWLTQHSNQKLYAVKEYVNGCPERKISREINVHNKMKPHYNVLSPICRIDKLDNKKSYSLLFPYINSGDLIDFTKHKTDLNMRKLEDYILALYPGLLRGIKHVHDNNICHRDIKPGNILWHRGDIKHPLSKSFALHDKLIIADFGCSNKKENLTNAAPTIIYAPPESYNYDRRQKITPAYDYRCDIWGIGATLLVIFSNDKIIFDDDLDRGIYFREGGYKYIKNTYPNIWNNFSNKSQNLLKATLEPDPNDRASIKELIDIARA